MNNSAPMKESRFSKSLMRAVRALARSVHSASWLLDVPLAALAWLAAYWLRFNFDVPADERAQALFTLPAALGCMAVGLLAARVPCLSWRFVSLADLRRLAAGVALGTLLQTALIMGLRVDDFPRSVLLISFVLTLLALLLARGAWRSAAEGLHAAPLHAKPLLIAGELADADQALRALRGAEDWHAVGIVTPGEADTGSSVQGVRVLGSVARVADIAAAHDVPTLLLAGAPGSALRRDVLASGAGSALTLLTLPSADELLSAGNGSGSAPRRVRLEDLLGRAPVQLDEAGLAAMLGGQVALVTGAGGSIGAELCRQVALQGAAELVCVDASEFAIYRLEQRLRREFPQLRAHYYTANVREMERLRAIFAAHRPAAVLHAAAYKHVPLMEGVNALEAIRTNALGTLNAARAAGEAGAARFVMISTDKAVNPTSVMGASKRLAEQIVQAVAAEHPATSYVSVRFGNVLGSSGSVVPLFERQIAAGGPVTVTHPDMVRYFMTIPEATQLVLQASLMGRSGQIFVLDMGEPVRIQDLARMLIRLSGKNEGDIPIVFTGLRPGEKLYEELLANDETTDATPHPKLRVAKTGAPPPDVISAACEWTENAVASADDVRAWLKGRLPEYQPNAQK